MQFVFVSMTSSCVHTLYINLWLWENEKCGKKSRVGADFSENNNWESLAAGTETTIGLCPMKMYVPLGSIDRLIVKADENLGIKTNLVFNVM